MLIEPAHEIIVLITQATSEGSGEPVHLRSLARAFAVHTHEVWKWTKDPTKNQTSSFTGWLHIHVWRMRTNSTIISWAGSIIKFTIAFDIFGDVGRVTVLRNFQPCSGLTMLQQLSRDMTKPTKWKTQISLGFFPVWSEASLTAWRKLGSFLATH